MSMDEEDITLMYRITKKGEVIQTLDIKLAFVQQLKWDELNASHCSTLGTAIKEDGVIKPSSCTIEV